MASVYKFNIGRFHCITFLDGTGPEMVRNLFRHLGDETLNQALNDAEIKIEDEKQIYYLNVLYVDTGDHKVLIDAGKERGASERTGYLQDLMIRENIQPDDIDTFIISHAHLDHISGLTDSEGNRVFKNARHIIWQEEWDYWMSQDNPPRKLAALGDMAKIGTEIEVVPGVQVIHAPGHTPGHLVIKIESQGEKLLYIADLVMHRLQFTHPEISTPFAVNGELAAESRRRILRLADDAEMLVQTYHLAFPGLGRIERNGSGYQWFPITLPEGD